MNAITKSPRRQIAVAAAMTEKVRSALDLWLAGFPSENTCRAYRREITAFATFAGRDNLAEAVAHFLALEDGQAHAVADAWRARKLEGGLSPASINRSMSALNSLVASARRHGITILRLEAKGVKSRAYRDTKGPGVRGVQNMLAAANEQGPEKAARDAAIIRIAYGLGLRRGEIESLDIGHLDLAAGTLFVLGKGRTEREPMTLPSNVKTALAAWLAIRGTHDRAAPLFIAMDRNTYGERLSGSGIYHIIRSQLGERAGVRARPHGLRHTAITAALDAFNGDYRKTRAFSRHASLDTVRRYDDNRADHAGQVAQALDSILG
ncbi:MAG: tyrosine-type recombinase/integrase [Rhodomicrobium sp.]